MFDIKKYGKDKTVGFYLSAALVVLMLVTAVIYAVCYTNTEHISWVAFVLLLVGAVAGAGLIALKQFRYVPVVLALFGFLGLLYYIYGIYYYVSVVMVGIDLETYDAQFIVCTILFVAVFVIGIADVFVRQTKKVEEAV